MKVGDKVLVVSECDLSGFKGVVAKVYTSGAAVVDLGISEDGFDMNGLLFTIAELEIIKGE